MPTCEECQQVMMEPGEGGRWIVQKHPPKTGKPIPRPKTKGKPWGMPCWKCPKSGEPDRPRPDREMNQESRDVYEYFRLCEADATGLLPRDLLVVEHNAWIRKALEVIDRSKPDRGIEAMLPFLAIMARK